uniref:Putative secreted protein n=1 Tax=Ixodes ricinus TaxID=34613 RepID=A0A6B0V670_IXORI
MSIGHPFLSLLLVLPPLPFVPVVILVVRRSLAGLLGLRQELIQPKGILLLNPPFELDRAVPLGRPVRARELLVRHEARRLHQLLQVLAVHLLVPRVLGSVHVGLRVAPRLVVHVVRVVVAEPAAQALALVEEPLVELDLRRPRPGHAQGDLLADVPLPLLLQLGPLVRGRPGDVALPLAVLVALVAELVSLPHVFVGHGRLGPDAGALLAGPLRQLPQVLLLLLFLLLG